MAFGCAFLLVQGTAALAAAAVLITASDATILGLPEAWTISVDQAIALVASIGSCVAALATYLTVREMRSGRMAAARARLTTPGSDRELRLVWHRPNNLAPEIPTERIIIRNASAGVAHNIRAKWKCDFGLDSLDIQQINEWLPHEQHVALSSPTVDFFDRQVKTSHIVANLEDTLYIGDIGPGQDVLCTIPQPILGSVFLKWASLLTRVAHGRHLRYEDVPLVRLSLVHNSPYEADITDELWIRFEVIEAEIRLRSVKRLPDALGGRWSTFSITLAFEPTARSLYDLPKVVVPAGGGNAG